MHAEHHGSPSEAELAERFWDRLRFFAARRLYDAAAAEDVAQDTLGRVLAALRQGRLRQPESLAAFVFQTALHVCLQYNRAGGRQKRAYRAVSHEESHGSRPGDVLSDLIAEERCSRVRMALRQLEEGDRQLLHLLYYEGVAAAEAAERLGITVETLRVRKHRALRRLEGHFQGDEEVLRNTSIARGTDKAGQVDG
jgi:RNA polymerase sigma-70 factor (ECF subfamily)